MSDQEKKVSVDAGTAGMESHFAGSTNRKPIKCPQCGTLNPGARTICKKCKTELPLP